LLIRLALWSVALAGFALCLGLDGPKFGPTLSAAIRGAAVWLRLLITTDNTPWRRELSLPVPFIMRESVIPAVALGMAPQLPGTIAGWCAPLLRRYCLLVRISS
jgi:hypothetical protein